MRFKYRLYFKGGVNLAKLDKYVYTGYSVELDSRSAFSLSVVSLGKRAIIFGADMISSVHIDNKKKDNLVIGEGLTKGLHDTTLTAAVKYPVNFTQSGKRFALSLNYNGSNSLFYLLILQKYIKQKESEIKE